MRFRAKSASGIDPEASFRALREQWPLANAKQSFIMRIALTIGCFPSRLGSE